MLYKIGLHKLPFNYIYIFRKICGFKSSSQKKSFSWKVVNATHYLTCLLCVFVLSHLSLPLRGVRTWVLGSVTFLKKKGNPFQGEEECKISSKN